MSQYKVYQVIYSLKASVKWHPGPKSIVISLVVSTGNIFYLHTAGNNINQHWNHDLDNQRGMMNGVLGHDSALVRLYWAGDNLGL